MCKKKFNLTNTGRGRLIWRCENDCTLSLPIQLSVGRRPPTARRRRRRRRPPKTRLSLVGRRARKLDLELPAPELSFTLSGQPSLAYRAPSERKHGMQSAQNRGFGPTLWAIVLLHLLCQDFGFLWCECDKVFAKRARMLFSGLRAPCGEGGVCCSGDRYYLQGDALLPFLIQLSTKLGYFFPRNRQKKKINKLIYFNWQTSAPAKLP